MIGYAWHCKTKGCPFISQDGPGILAHGETTGHVGTRLVFVHPEPIPRPTVPPPLFRRSEAPSV